MTARQTQQSPFEQPDAFRSVLERTLPDALPHWLETRRWFADKGRGITSIAVEDVTSQRADGDWLALTVVDVAFREGDSARYFVPLALTRSPGGAESIVSDSTLGDPGALVDATETEWFGGWLLAAFDGTAPKDDERWSFSVDPGAGDVIERARKRRAELLGAEQSNSSLRFDQTLVVKLFRRLQPGPNPDEEVLRALAHVGFSAVPRYVAAASWRSRNGREHPVALGQAFVPNEGDGWSWMLARLSSVASPDVDLARDDFAAERLLGRRTGEMHVALSEISDPAFAPRIADWADSAINIRRVADAAGEARRLLLDFENRLRGSLRDSLPRAVTALDEVSARSAGFQEETGTGLIRVHGDFHLGQTLRTPDGDWVIIDFEGEPARSVAERRRKTSALKDVGGMLRSFAYARGTAERIAIEHGDGLAVERLARWETGARRAFLQGYREAIRAAPVPLVPEDDTAFARALAAWELDKALYEVAYEVRNRPGWLALPLRALLPDLALQSVETAGGALA